MSGQHDVRPEGVPALNTAPTPLAELFGDEVESFLARSYPGRHLAVHGTVDRLPGFFTSGVFASPRALAAAYDGPVYVTNRTLARCQIQGVGPRECFEELGLSVGFVEIEKLAPGASEWLHALEAELGMPRGSGTIAVFVNAPNSGLSVHCDEGEQIAIHLRGPKAFRIAPHPARFPRMKHVPGIGAEVGWLAQSPGGLLDRTTLPEDAERIDLHPGSVLFTPRGLYHETLSGDAIAMTAVIAFRNPTPAEMLTRYLEQVLLQSEEWRRPLDFGWSTEPERQAATSARMQALLEQAARRIGSLSVPQLLSFAEPGRRLDASTIADTTRFQRDPSTVVHFAEDPRPGRIRMEIGLELGSGATASCSLPADLLPLLEWLAASRAPVTVVEACARFPEWDRSAVVATLVSLVRSKALLELPFEAW